MRNSFCDLWEKLSDPISTAFNKNKMEKKGEIQDFQSFQFSFDCEKIRYTHWLFWDFLFSIYYG